MGARRAEQRRAQTLHKRWLKPRLAAAWRLPLPERLDVADAAVANETMHRALLTGRCRSLPGRRRGPCRLLRRGLLGANAGPIGRRPAGHAAAEPPPAPARISLARARGCRSSP